METLETLENIIGYTFSDRTLLETALTHSSYANERHTPHLPSNERLEFLGDSILGIISAEYLFRNLQDQPEGELTKLRAAVVCEQSLYAIAQKLSLANYLFLGSGEEQSGGRSRPSILADAVEALLAAIYLDGGMEEAKTFIMGFLPDRLQLALKGKAFVDYKTTLQEIVQKNHEETLRYRVKEERGPDHNKVFVVELLLNSNVFSQGEGRSKKEAEQMAAKAALELMGEL